MTIFNFEKLINTTLEHYNEIVIDSSKLVRFIGCAETKDDYYYVLKSEDGTIFYASCCGRLIYLKDHIPDEEYFYLDNMFHGNDCQREEAPLIKSS